MYKDSEGSLFVFRSLGNSHGLEHFYCDLNAEEIIDVFTHLIENKRDTRQTREAYCRRGEAYLHQGAADLAIRDFAEALNRDPKMPEAYHGRGNAYRDQGDVERAMADMEEATRLKPELAAPLIDRGNMHRESGSLEQAIEDLDTAITRMSAMGGGTGDGDGHFYRAVARCAQQDWGRAKSDFETASQKGVLVASSFCAIFGGVPDFEAVTACGSLPTLRQYCTLSDPRTQRARPATTRVRRSPGRGGGRGDCWGEPEPWLPRP